MKNNKLFLIAALLGTVLAGCQKVSEIQTPEEKPDTQGWKLTVQVSKDAGTRALEYNSDGDNNYLRAYWANGEKVDVYLVGGGKLGTLEVITETGADPATLSGEIEVDGVTAESQLMLIYPGKEDAAWTYEDQTGLAVDDAYDYATAEVEVASLDASTQTVNITPDADGTQFKNEQSVYRFGFKAEDDFMSAYSLLITAVGDKDDEEDRIVVNRTLNDGEWTSNRGMLFMEAGNRERPEGDYYFVALRNEIEDAPTQLNFLVVQKGGLLRFGSKTINKVLENGKLYKATIKADAYDCPETYDGAHGELASAANIL